MFRFARRSLAALTLALCGCVHAARFDDEFRMASSNVGLQSFAWRRVHGSGQYLGWEELQADRLLPLADLLRARFRGFQMPPTALALPASAPSVHSTIPTSCPTQVYVNGMPAPGALDGGLQASDLAGAEYYSGATAPAQYLRAWAACPVLLLWLKP